MINIALLGFGVVGSGCAEVLTSVKDKIAAQVGDEIGIKYILDLRDFPDSPFGKLIVHDFDELLVLGAVFALRALMSILIHFELKHTHDD